jgi:prepilin-type N-terminal cleavage/methylation domain-containing protein
MNARLKEAGFTLVEIAIVLVIIGLLLGGILKGQELITSARVRNLADQGSAVQAAYYGFVDRYHAIPGDMLATQVCGAIGNTVSGCPGPGVGGAPPTGGNSTIDQGNWAEASAVWSHLTAAGFLQGTYPGNASAATYTQTTPSLAPQNPWGGSLLLARTGEYLDASTGTIPPRLHLIIGRNIPVNVVRELDVKIDDSLPRSGVLRAPATGATSFATVGQEGTPTCVGPDPAGGPNPIWDINGASADCNGYYLF